jgi:hypothetical protein
MANGLIAIFNQIIFLALVFSGFLEPMKRLHACSFPTNGFVANTFFMHSDIFPEAIV